MEVHGGFLEAFEVCQNVQGLWKVKRDQTERCVGQKEEEKKIQSLSAWYRRAPTLMGGGPPLPTSNRTGKEENNWEGHSNPSRVHSLYENILNSIRVCKFHELSILLLKFLTGVSEQSELWRLTLTSRQTETDFCCYLTPLQPLCSYSDLFLSQAPKSHYTWNLRGKCNTIGLPFTIWYLEGNWNGKKKKKNYNKSLKVAAQWGCNDIYKDEQFISTSSRREGDGNPWSPDVLIKKCSRSSIVDGQ